LLSFAQEAGSEAEANGEVESSEVSSSALEVRNRLIGRLSLASRGMQDASAQSRDSVVEKIFCHRRVKKEGEAEEKLEFFVKWLGKAYIYCEWVPHEVMQKALLHLFYHICTIELIFLIYLSWRA
jgi:hypothetical protein